MNIASIGSDNIEKLAKHINKSFFANFYTINHLKEDSDILNFNKKNLYNKNFLDLILGVDYILIDGLINHREFSINSNKILFNYQKLIYHIYSINSNSEILVSLFNLDENLKVKMSPNFFFHLNNCKVIKPEDSPSLRYKDINNYTDYFKNIFSMKNKIKTTIPTKKPKDKYSSLKKILEKKKNNVII